MKHFCSRTKGPLAVVLCATLIAAPFTPVRAEGSRGLITGDGVTTRSGPGIEYDRIGRLNAGETVTVLGEIERWLMVRDKEGREVWVFAKWVEILPDMPVPESQDVSGIDTAPMPPDSVVIPDQSSVGEAIEPPPLILSEKEDTGLPWLWIGVGAVAAGGLAALALGGGNDENGDTGVLSFDIQFP